MINKICNERGIFIRHVIIGGGIGIFIVVVLLVASKVTGVVFSWVIMVIVFSCLFIFYEPRIKKAKVSKDGVEFEMYKAIIIKQGQAEPIPPEKSECAFSMFGIEIEAYGTDDQAKQVIKSIGGTKYTFRNIGGITKDSNLSEDIVKDKLCWLVLHGFADEFEISGEKMYALSLKGYSAFSNISDQT